MQRQPVEYHPTLFEEDARSTKNIPTMKELEQNRVNFLRTPSGVDGQPDIFSIKNQGSWKLSPNSQEIRQDNSHVLSGIEKTPLIVAYFSRDNVLNIQNLLKIKVYEQSQLQIDTQSMDELLKTMKYIFITYANPPVEFDPRIPMANQKELIEQNRVEIARLNELVIRYLFPRIISELSAHLGYLRDASQSIPVMETPVNMSSAGLRSYRSQV